MRAARQPCWVKPAIGGPVIGQARNVPMADVARVNIPHGWAAADEDNAAGIFLQDLIGIHVRAQDVDRAIGKCKFRYAGDRLRTCEQDVTARDVEEARDVRDVFRVRIPLPR